MKGGRRVVLARDVVESRGRSLALVLLRRPPEEAQHARFGLVRHVFRRRGILRRRRPGRPRSAPVVEGAGIGGGDGLLLAPRTTPIVEGSGEVRGLLLLRRLRRSRPAAIPERARIQLRRSGLRLGWEPALLRLEAGLDRRQRLEAPRHVRAVRRLTVREIRHDRGPIAGLVARLIARSVGGRIGRAGGSLIVSHGVVWKMERYYRRSTLRP